MATDYGQLENLKNNYEQTLSRIRVICELSQLIVWENIDPALADKSFHLIEGLSDDALNGLELAAVLPEKVVKPDDALDEGRRRGVVHDVCDGEVEKGRKVGSVFKSLCRSEESVSEKFDVAKRIRVSEGVVVGDGTGDTCSVSDGGVSLFGFHASYFTKFKTPGWVPSTLLDLAMTSVFAQAMLGRDEGMMWFNLNRKFAWKGL